MWPHFWLMIFFCNLILNNWKGRCGTKKCLLDCWQTKYSVIHKPNDHLADLITLCLLTIIFPRKYEDRKSSFSLSTLRERSRGAGEDENFVDPFYFGKKSWWQHAVANVGLNSLYFEPKNGRKNDEQQHHDGASF